MIIHGGNFVYLPCLAGWASGVGLGLPLCLACFVLSFQAACSLLINQAFSSLPPDSCGGRIQVRSDSESWGELSLWVGVDFEGHSGFPGFLDSVSSDVHAGNQLFKKTEFFY